MTGHIFIEGEVGKDVTTKTVREDIANYPHAKDWLVHINSGGGEVNEGYAIGNILATLPKTHAQIGASCCSISTYIAESCEKITMSPHGDWMIHLPTGQMQGNEHDFDRAANQLRRIKSELADKYMKRVARKGTLTRAQVLEMIEKETSMSPSEALQFGFIDDVQEKLRAVANFDITKITNMENITRTEVEGLFTKMGEKINKFLAKFKNQVQIALADGTMASSDAPTPEELVGSVLTGPNGPIPDGSHPTADGFVVVISGGKVESYGPATEDKTDDNAVALKALQEENAALKEQLAAKTTEAATAVQAKAQMETEFQNEFKNMKSELDSIKKKTLGDPNPPKTDKTFKADAKEKQEKHDPMASLWEVFETSR